MNYPYISLETLDNLWFQIGGTICNLECVHCFISCGPKNHSFGFMPVGEVKKYLLESEKLGVKEYYFTGGEPFMNRDIVEILEETLKIGPATVLTNATILKDKVIKALSQIEANSIYSLEFRVSLDGFRPEENDPIRGEGTFNRAMEGVKLLVDYGFLPIITATRVWAQAEDERVQEGFIKALKAIGYQRPRLKILPSLKIGRELLRIGDYEDWEVVTEDMMDRYDAGQLICSKSRMVTDKGVYVCPILIDFPDAKLGDNLKESFQSFGLRHKACYTCYTHGAICSNLPWGIENV